MKKRRNASWDGNAVQSRKKGVVRAASTFIYLCMISELMSLKFWIGVAVYLLFLVSIIIGSVIVKEKFGIDLVCPALFSVVLLVFLFLILIGYRSNQRLNKNEMRRAIAGSMIIAIVAILFFSVQLDKELLTFFLGVISTVIGFYFGYRKTEKDFSDVPTKDEVENVIEILKEDKAYRDVANDVVRRAIKFWGALDDETKAKVKELLKLLSG